MINDITRKPYLDAEDVKNRYHVGINKAYEIIRCVHRVCGSKLGPGKVLLCELLRWESTTTVDDESNA